jgi:hypothetical protein
MVSVLCLMALVPCDGSDAWYFRAGSCNGGHIRGNPVAIVLVYVMGLLCCYVSWSPVMVSVSCLVGCVTCRGMMLDISAWILSWWHSRGNPVATLMADVLGLDLLLLALAPCYGFCFVVDCAGSDV